MLKLMDVESFQHIRAVRNLRGSRLPRGRALPPEEVRALFAACEADDSSIGIRDAAMLAVILGCGLRRSEAVVLICVTLSQMSGHSCAGQGKQGAAGLYADRHLAAS
jgi:site-specific recombinase XerD